MKQPQSKRIAAVVILTRDKLTATGVCCICPLHALSVQAQIAGLMDWLLYNYYKQFCAAKLKEATAQTQTFEMDGWPWHPSLSQIRTWRYFLTAS